MGGRRLAVFVAAAVVSLTGGAGSLAASAAPAAPDPLVERATCAAPTGAARQGASGPGETRVTFDVAPLARLEVDGSTLVAAMTNTGCAPRPTDTFVVGARPATGDEVAAALVTFTTGDWRQPGVRHRA
jgi:hypothetical protein